MSNTEGIAPPTYDPAGTLRGERARYFERYGFGDGGYDATWVELNKVGPIPVGFPNTAARVRAVKLHDLHHVLTGYAADYIGEAEIAAWELGAGCGGHLAAWVLNFAGITYGAFLAPRRVVAALSRGRRSRSLYQHAELPEALLERRVEDVRRELALDVPSPPPTAVDWLLLGAGVLLGASVALAPLALLAAGLAALA